MFALEIAFKGDEPSSETVFVRRPTAIISARSTAHVVVDDMSVLGYGISITREVGRRFKLSPVSEDQSSYLPEFLEGVYEGVAVIDLGIVVFHITALDNDLLPRDSEPPDRAGVRVLRQACAGPGPTFPAVVVRSRPPAVISFAPDQPLIVGRSRQCTLRVDLSSVSTRHARIGFESGEFWVEDLGSANGTFVNDHQISGRVSVPSGSAISLAHDVSLIGVVSAEEMGQALQGKESKTDLDLHEKRYPLLISVSEAARPAQLMLTPGSSIVLGREPSSDMWLGAPHVSRKHCVVDVLLSGAVRVTDTSTNGTAYDRGILRRDEATESTNTPVVLDFGGGVTVALCFNAEQEARFVATNGAPTTFYGDAVSADRGDSPDGTQRRRKSTTFLRTPEEVRDIMAELSQERGLRGLYRRLSGAGRIVLFSALVGIVAVTITVVTVLVTGWR